MSLEIYFMAGSGKNDQSRICSGRIVEFGIAARSADDTHAESIALK
jgi:hypothetical protein